MKGKRYTTEEKIRMLRQADEGAREGERTVKTDAGGQDAGDRDPAGDPGKKTVSSGHKGKWQRDLWLGASVRCERGDGTFSYTVPPMRIGPSIRMPG